MNKSKSKPKTQVKEHLITVVYPEMTIERMIKMFQELYERLMNDRFCLYCQGNLFPSGCTSPYVGERFMTDFEFGLHQGGYGERKIEFVVKCPHCQRKMFQVINPFGKLVTVPYDYFDHIMNNKGEE